MDAIWVQGLRKDVVSGSERISVLKGIDLAVPSGRIVAIMGPSGSGKSTLLSLLGGLDRPTAGRVVVGGEVLSERSEAELTRWRRENLGFVFQSFHLFRALTVLENVAVPVQLAGRKDAYTRPRQLLEAVGLGGRLNHYPRSSRAANSSGSPSPGPLRPAPASSSPTNPPEIWTGPRARK